VTSWDSSAYVAPPLRLPPKSAAVTCVSSSVIGLVALYNASNSCVKALRAVAALAWGSASLQAQERPASAGAVRVVRLSGSASPPVAATGYGCGAGAGVGPVLLNHVALYAGLWFRGRILHAAARRLPLTAELRPAPYWWRPGSRCAPPGECTSTWRHKVQSPPSSTARCSAAAGRLALHQSVAPVRRPFELALWTPSGPGGRLRPRGGTG